VLEIRTSAGRVRGEQLSGGPAGGIRRFLGIPHAARPARFQPPTRPHPWDGVRPATAFGPSAIQSLDSPLGTAVPGMLVGAVDEDCLSVNVWTPVGAEHRPVLVWIHGGAYQIGGSSLETYDGARLAGENDVVVVSCNYRLGALGFAVLPGGTANVALLDMLSALRWVQDEIAQFGGDPDRVTVFGESAGAGSIRHLLATPARKGLFRRAILQSPGAEVVERAAAVELAARFVSHLEGVAPEVAPTELVLAAQEKAAADMASALGFMPWSPVVDGDVVATVPPGDAADIDVIVGTTSEELSLFGAQELTDTMMRIPATLLADELSRHNPATYTYSFEWQAPVLGAAHAVDLPFTFGTFDRCGWGAFVGADEEAWVLADAIGASWAAFAAHGDPSNDCTGRWSRHDPADRRTMVLGRRIGDAPNPVPVPGE